jgi:hypothetical protein
MNLSDEQRDAMLIDRLVDGELSGDERRHLLASLEAQPGGWRRCALAFVEAQTWRGSMGSLLQDTPAPIEPKSLPIVVANSGSAGALSARSEASRSHLATWFAVAASVVVAFGLGRQSGVMRSANEPASQQIASAPAVPNDKTDSPRLEHSTRGDAVTLVVNDRDGVPQRIEVPLVEGRQLGRAFGDVPHWSSPELDRQLDERGLDLDARRRYAPMYFEQENKIVPMVVPVDDAVVRPASRPVY